MRIEMSSVVESMQLLHGFAEFANALKQSAKLVQWNHIRSVARRAVGVGVRFEEKSVNADRSGRAGQRLDHRAVAARGAAQPAGLLDAVRGIENDGHAEGAHF